MSTNNHTAAPQPSEDLSISVSAEFVGVGGEGASEVVAHENGVLYVTNGEEDRIDVFDLSGTNPPQFIDLTTVPEYDGVQSVAVRNGVIATAIERAPADAGGTLVAQPGIVALYDAATLGLLATIDVGNLPDAVAFTPDGNTLVVAGEGEKNVDSDNEDNPPGTISLVDTSDPSNPSVEILDFTAFDGTEDALRAQGIRITEGVPVSEDVEPEYVTISEDGATAYVSLQENNAIAVVDLLARSITEILPAGEVDYASSDNALDPDDDGTIAIEGFDDLVGMRMPDGLATAQIGGETFILGGNEGDGRGDFDEGPLGDEASVEDIIDGEVPGVSIDPSVDTTGLGELTISTVDGDTDDDGDIDELHAFGSRSFTIYDENGNVVFDSGPQFERIIAEVAPERFNDDDGDTDGDEDRSDNKGPEPEAVEVGEIGGETYAFIGLERDSGIMIYNITDPENAFFVDYVEPAFVDTTPEGDVARHAPEVIEFIPQSDSLSGSAQIAVSYEVSGTTVVYDLAPVTPFAAIPEIQGAGHLSPLSGQTVRTTGIVTAVDFNGYYLQDPMGDGDDATSDGIFVFTGSGAAQDLVSVGDEVRIEGEVSEFIPGGAGTGNLSITQISSSEARILSTGNDLPEAELIGEDDRLPPDENVISDDELPVNLQDVPGEFDPEEDAIDFFESLEGMRVTVDDPVAVQPLNRFDEFNVLADDGESASTPINDRGGINIEADPDGRGDLNPERIQIAYDGFFDLVDQDAVPDDVTVGDGLSNITGVVDYSFGNYEVLVTEGFTVEDESPITAETTTLSGSFDQLTVATYNVLNLTGNTVGPQGDDQADPDDDDDVAEIEAIAGQIVNNLGAPDILALQEIQDDSGEDDDGTLSAEGTLQAVVDAIAAAGGPTYQFASAQVDVDGETGGVPGGNIRNAFLWNPERTELTGIETLELGNEEGDPFFDTRDPLIGTFTFNGQEVTVINNHFSSRFGSTPIFGGPQPFVQAGEDDRAAQALAVNQRVDEILADDPDADVIVLGDLNTFEFTDEITEDLQGVGDDRVLQNLINEVPEGERYTFNFEGNSQVLDHILATPGLAERAEIDIVHTNVDFPDAEAASDHEPVVARFTLPGTLLVGDDDDNRLEAGDQPAIVFGAGGNDTVRGGPGDDTVAGGEDDDTIDGGEGDDRAFGGNGNDGVTGGSGDDVGRGAEGDDTIAGGAGNDSLIGDAGDDEIAGGAGDDRANGGAGDDGIDGGNGGDTIRGAAGDDSMSGGTGADALLGGIGADAMFGDEGGDLLLGDGGNDVLFGGGGNDRVKAGAGDDLVAGEEGDDVLVGDAGVDDIVGGLGDDNLFGGEGDDALNGGAGNDTVRGGDGADLVVLNEGEGSVTVKDFAQGEDRLVLPEEVTFDDLVLDGGIVSIGTGEEADELAIVQGGVVLVTGDFLSPDAMM